MPSKVLVVGGNGGLGSVVCDLLAEQGLQPIVGWAHSKAAAETVAARCHGVIAQVDLTRPAEALAAAQEAIGQSRLCGIVLAGAGAPAVETFAKLNPDALRQRLDMDVFGSIALLNPLVRQYMKPARCGCVVGVLSEAMGTPEKASMPAMAGYVIGKYALAGVCAALAADNPWLAVRTVAPGFMETAMLNSFDERFVAGLRQAGRVESPAAIAKAVVAVIVGAVP